MNPLSWLEIHLIIWPGNKVATYPLTVLQPLRCPPRQSGEKDVDSKQENHSGYRLGIIMFVRLACLTSDDKAHWAGY